MRFPKQTKTQTEYQARTMDDYEYARSRFDANFPTVADFSVFVDETDFGIPVGNTYSRSRSSFNPIFCGNVVCEHGGLDWLSVLKDMIRNNDQSRAINERCSGSLGNGKTCERRFVGKIAIKQKKTGE